MPAGGTGSSRNPTWGGPDLLLMGQPPGCPRFGVFATADIRILTRTSTGFPDRQMAGRETPGGGLQDAGLPDPTFQEDQGFSVIFRKDVVTRDDLIKEGLSERQVAAVLYAKENGKITNAGYQKLADVSAATARRDLKTLVDKNILDMKGIRKGIFYVIKSRR